MLKSFTVFNVEQIEGLEIGAENDTEIEAEAIGIRRALFKRSTASTSRDVFASLTNESAVYSVAIKALTFIAININSLIK